MTSNIATEELVEITKDPDLAPPYGDLVEQIKPAMLKVFPPALLGRIVTVPFMPFTDDVLTGIIKLKLHKLTRRMKNEHDLTLSYSEHVIEFVDSRCKDAGAGARMIDAILTNTLLPKISRRLLERMLTGEETKAIHVDVSDGQLAIDFS